MRATLLLLALAIAATAAPLGASGPPLQVVASGLANPRKLFVGAGGAVYVVEAGTGGRDTCVGAGPARACVGLTGAIARVAGGPRRRVVTGLLSFARPDGGRAQGPAAAVVRGRTFDVLLQDGAIDSAGGNDLGPDGVTGGDLISTPAGRADPTVLASLAAFEAAHDPDRGAGPGPRFGDPPIDSDPYGLTPYRGGFAVVDAAGNDLLQVGRDGRISVLAVFPTRRVPLPRAVGRRYGAPASMRTIAAQSVPTCVAVGPDGALYVGELTGVPYAPGAARVWRVEPGRRPEVFASGFTTIADLAFDGSDLLVLELTTKGLLGPPSPGELVRVAPDGTRTVLARAGLVDPTGIAVAGRWIYVANDGLSPHGEVVRLPRARSGG